MPKAGKESMNSWSTVCPVRSSKGVTFESLLTGTRFSKNTLWRTASAQRLRFELKWYSMARTPSKIVCHWRSGKPLPSGVCGEQHSKAIPSFARAWRHGLQSYALSACSTVPVPNWMATLVGTVLRNSSTSASVSGPQLLLRIMKASLNVV